MLHADKCLREERFFIPEKLCNKSFNEWNWTVAEFIHKWEEENMSNKIGENKDAQWLAEQLRLVKPKGEDEIYKLFILLYTYECFLYKLINKTLREDDYSKIQTLAPFCGLLHTSNCVAATKSYIYKGKVYRGMHLDQEQIECSNQAIKNDDKQWLGFSSTS
ncbi:unnamed protein product [Didymodactylos carnosus]|uniref:Uncharacterized protein n=1 Tax=Didymodactylos carnosus TaxID=1234261 RepID=A0A813Y8N1_9BILA|nr:unnamed protein product [Didymodactylos carnosus]CAF3666896.1 unnamed protein product [Didymodactylos carnosus]